MNKELSKSKRQRKKALDQLPRVGIPKESIALLEYIQLIGAKRSSFNILGAAESHLKVKGPVPFQFTSY
jgi:hypothetical protein